VWEEKMGARALDGKVVWSWQVPGEKGFGQMDLRSGVFC
jgi:hypothetical protein